MDNNLLSPLTFDDGQIDRFIARHVCALCLGHLNKFPGPGRNWIAKCPIHGPIMAHMAIGKGKAGRIRNSINLAAREIRPPEQPKAEREIVRELGGIYE